MKASEIKPGDVLDGWTVTRRQWADRWDGMSPAPTEHFVLLELERSLLREGAPERHDAYETRRTWYRADEEVECE